MSIEHKLIDAGLWFIAVLWFCQFVADFTREHSRLRRIRKLAPPSKDCDRYGNPNLARMHSVAISRRQWD